ncbi:MAG: helix-turn-helix domain-containing protein [Aurantibacter sp.]
MLILFNVLLINYLLADVTIRMEFTVLSFFFHVLIPFYTPCFVLYALVLMDRRHTLRRQWWWIVFPATLYAVIALVDFVIINKLNVRFVESLYTQPSILYQVLYKGQILFAVFLLLWMLRKIREYQRNIKENYSYIEHLHLNWVRIFAYINIAQNILIVGVFLLFSMKYLTAVEVPFLIINTVMVLSVFYLSYHGIRQYNLAEFDVLLHKEGKNLLYSKGKAEESNEKYKSSSLSHAEMETILEQVTALFETKEIYLEPQLKISEVAEMLNVSTHNISQTINLKTDQSFYDLVNGYRVNYFKNLLADPENRKYTILALGFESGFNSKATLNRIFRQSQGVSPKEFQMSQTIG